MSPVAVTGMHRTGTSMIARALREAGLHLGEDRDMVDPAPDNPEGFFEHAGFVHLNDDLLEATGGSWDQPPHCGPLADDDPRVEPLGAAARTLVGSLDRIRPWGWKDPRTCLTARFWLDLLPDLQFIVCVRHPLEVGLSLKRRNRSSYALALQLWQTYYETLLAVVPPDRRVVTHYDAHFRDGDAELERLARFAGVSSERLTEAAAARRVELRHHRVQLTLEAAGASHSLVALYEQLCDEAAWQLEPQPPSTPGKIARATIDLELATEHLEQRGRKIAALEHERDELGQRVAALEAVVEGAGLAGVHARLDGLDKAVHDLRYAQERLDGRGDADMVRACRELVQASVPSGDRVLVVAKSDPALLDLYGRPASNFPQGDDGRYLGFSFAHDDAAIAHLEALRVRGHRFLLVPESASWWLEHLPVFREHLLDRYPVLVAERDAGVLVDLRARRELEHAWPPAVLDTVARLADANGRRPAVLDWTGAGAADLLPEHTVFVPLDDGDALPYLDRSVDVVLVADPARVAEARRVAATAVVETARDGDHLSVVRVETTAHSLGPCEDRPLRVVVTADDPDPRWLALLGEALSREPATELSVVPANAGVPNPGREGELLALVEPGVVPLPGCITAARSAVDGDRVGAVAVKLFAADGSLEAAGAFVFADGTSAGVAAGLHDATAPWHDYVRDTCWGPGLLVADGAAAAAAGPLPVPGPAAHAAWCGRVWSTGHQVVYQPEAAAVRASAAPQPTDARAPSPDDVWGSVLRERPERPAALDERAWRGLLARDDVGEAWR